MVLKTVCVRDGPSRRRQQSHRCLRARERAVLIARGLRSSVVGLALARVQAWSRSRWLPRRGDAGVAGRHAAAAASSFATVTTTSTQLGMMMVTPIALSSVLVAFALHVAATTAASARQGEPLELSPAASPAASPTRRGHANGSSHPLDEYTNWSDWSVCDRYCQQNRVKRCQLRDRCGRTVLREERVCEHGGLRKNSRCKHQQQRAARRKPKHFRIVQIPEEAKPRHGRGKKGDNKDWFKGHYGKWSKWSSCTRSCTTQRHRWCRIPGLCMKDVIRQTAYCYVQGSYCQRWIRRKIRNNYDDTSNDLTVDKYDLNINGIENSTHDETSWKCGVSSKDTRLSYLTRIIGGRPATPGGWPWQVAVLNRYGEAFCGGTLVSPRWVLTAAHCVRKRLSVRIGEHNLLIKEGTEVELRVDYAVTHPKYNAHTVDNDIALLRLPITLTPADSRGIACLPAPWQELPSDQLCTIIGWGKANASHEFGTDVLHETKIPIVSDTMCRNVYVDYKITGNMFCAGYRSGRMDSCAGDSGGPLLCRDPEKTEHPWTIFGITSFGEGCGKRGKYGIYARLSNYVHWINKVIKQTGADDED